eukprot:15470055-Alexandrium_andersonii.AAC.1
METSEGRCGGAVAGEVEKARRPARLTDQRNCPSPSATTRGPNMQHSRALFPCAFVGPLAGQ